MTISAVTLRKLANWGVPKVDDMTRQDALLAAADELDRLHASLRNIDAVFDTGDAMLATIMLHDLVETIPGNESE